MNTPLIYIKRHDVQKLNQTSRDNNTTNHPTLTPTQNLTPVSDGDAPPFNPVTTDTCLPLDPDIHLQPCPPLVTPYSHPHHSPIHTSPPPINLHLLPSHSSPRPHTAPSQSPSPSYRPHTNASPAPGPLCRTRVHQRIAASRR
jgi:hypothetical protein